MTTNNAGGEQNVAIGNYAGDAITSGDGNTAFGHLAGTVLNTGGGNTCIGYGSGGVLTSGSDNVLIGLDAGNVSTGSNQLYIARTNGNNSVASVWIYGSATGACYQGNNDTAWSQSSDERIKKNIVNSPNGLAKIDALKVRNFNFRTQDEVTVEGLNTSDAPGLQTGVIAQEIESVLPESVTENAHGQKEVRSDPIFWAMVKSIQELSAKNDSLETANHGIAARITALENA